MRARTSAKQRLRGGAAPQGLRNIKLVLEYDGSSFSGFQRQPGRPTVQEAIENALSKLFNRQTKIQAASGRTDAGVHAEGQVVNFKTTSRLAVPAIQRALNSILPKAIAVKNCGEAHRKFHARYSARSKIYEYRIWNSPVRSPLAAGRTFQVPYALDIRRIKRGMSVLKGRHDFRAFASMLGPSNGSREKNTVRNLFKLELRRRGPLLTFRLEADGFLTHMVRNIIGTLIEIGRGKIAVEDLKSILSSRDRSTAGPTVPAAGLTLIDVTY